jgi:hypothetical protein
LRGKWAAADEVSWEFWRSPPAAAETKCSDKRSVGGNLYYVNRDNFILRLLVEDNRLLSVQQDTVFHVPSHRSGKHDFFQVAAFV